MGGGLVPKIIEIDVPVIVTGDDHHPHSRHHCAGRVGPVCRRGDEADIPVTLTIGLMKGSDAKQPRILTL